ncbi:DNA repair endonuclease XPF [Bulinus truncatus]|nr:DNA repair endonuclease XPF [Bulinus truncatus]
MQAKQRVYGQVKCSKTSNTKKDGDEIQESSEDEEEVSHGLEQCPKWKALTEVLDEIKQEEDECVEVAAPGPSNELQKPGTRILICAEDDRTCNQIKEYLCDGGDELMQRLFRKYLAMKKGSKQLKQNEDKTGKVKDKESKINNKPTKEDPISLTLTQMMKTTKEDVVEGKNGSEPLTTSKDAYGGLVQSPMTIIHPLHGCSDPHGLSRTLEEVQPKFVILYDADISLVRQLEVFKATRPGQQLRVYFMIYKESVEEQRYLTALRKEKEAFEFLIREKATMVISEEQDGKSENISMLTRDVGHKSSSSRSGGVETPETQKIIVDMREFRSELPSLIHRRGIEIEPVTLEVGDYILTPEICVERKSISDLIGSLNNGRLYQQALSMCRFYKKPMVLIEFDTNKPFALQVKTSFSSDVSIQDITTKLAILTMQFPKLRLLWCPSPYASAELFDELKAGRPQPNAEMAMTVTAASSDMPDWTDKYNHGPQDFVLRMPGINSKNYHCILNKFTNLYEVSQASLEHLTQVLGSSAHAQQLYDFLHKEHKLPSESEVATAAETKKNWKGKSKGFYGKGKGIKRKKVK